MISLCKQKASCFGCGACAAACPAGAVTMRSDEEGFLYPQIDPELCTECGNCVRVCPADIPVQGETGEPFAVRCIDQELLYWSTSGGAFSLLADAVLQSGGLVCGAAFDEKDGFRVRHIISEDIAGMRKSKYIQSDLIGLYEKILTALAEGRKVLFTGTPCQCDGVRRFFGKEQKGLILAALICRGVLSPGLWKDYVDYLAGEGTLEAYCFRDKRRKNDAYTVAYTVDGTERALPMGQDPFSRIYMKCIAFRPSCYRCPYTKWELPFDLTIGDYWGVEKEYPELADGMGTSLVIVRTQKGRELLEEIRSGGDVRTICRENAQQPALKEPAKETILRRLLFRDYANKRENGTCDIALLLKKYGG